MNCSYRYHETFAGERKICCPACNGGGKLTIVSERGEPQIETKPTFRAIFGAFTVALVEYIVFRVKGGK